jgi:hypothetical protein
VSCSSAIAVASDDERSAWDMRNELDDLAAKSMVDLDTGPADSTRYRLLETLRQFALERLDDARQAEEYRRRHAAYYAEFAEQAGPGLQGPDEVAWAARFDAELDNLRAAVAWALDTEAQADADLGLRIIGGLASQWLHRPSIGVGEWAESALDRAETSTPGRRTAVLAVAAWQAYMNGDLELMRTRAQAALRDGLPPDTPSPAWAYGALAALHAFDGDHEAASRTLAAGEQALERVGAQEPEHLWLGVIRVLSHLLAGQYDAARASAVALLRRARAHANPSLLISALAYFAWTRRPDESEYTIQVLEECLAQSRTIASPSHTLAVRALGMLARLRAERGERSDAIDAFHDGVVRAYDTGQLPIMAFVLNHGVSVATDLEAWPLSATLGAALTGGALSGLTLLVHPEEHKARQAALDHAREQLDPDSYQEALTRGTALSYQQIVDYTLSELDRLSVEPPS